MSKPMPATAPKTELLNARLANEQATILLAQDIAAALMPGDIIALEGDLGAGKTAFCRALIRAIAGDENLEVPSPTFSIMQPYDIRLPVRHFDMYRLAGVDELEEIGFFDELENVVTLIEWPSRVEAALPPEHIVLALDIIQGDERSVTLAVPTSSQNRFMRALALRRFVDDAGYAGANRDHVQGDVSHRSYERVTLADKPSAILMNSPKAPVGAVLQDGKTYDDLVHRALDTKPFATVVDILSQCGLSAPQIFHADHDNGFLLLEDFGSQGILYADGSPDEERYHATVDALAKFHQSAPVHASKLPPFDRDAFLTEVSLFPDWYSLHRGVTLSKEARTQCMVVWSQLYDDLAEAENGVFLRDVHSPNLMWLSDRQGTDRVGFLDIQDALHGPQLYDMASLIYDARVDISPTLRQSLIARYAANRGIENQMQHVNAPIAILAAQRISKILGIFARLARRDAITSYLEHMPRNETYLRELLRTPALAPLARWHHIWLPFADTEN